MRIAYQEKMPRELLFVDGVALNLPTKKLSPRQVLEESFVYF
ncbi:hypothetical protein AsAng_0051770 [Aureispira anguillae]|uniref:Uncharacterized protein n=1 Tax=Aureispira anguillae TaxID=2864201 RepID=A0A916DW39_9BACT|nr:hypothetical protein AsAng_0051770 [Aureispira anguillae]